MFNLMIQHTRAVLMKIVSTSLGLISKISVPAALAKSDLFEHRCQMNGPINQGVNWVSELAGWPRVIAHPGLPQIRTCGITASGSSSNSFASMTAHRIDGCRVDEGVALLKSGEPGPRQPIPALAAAKPFPPQTPHLLPGNSRGNSRDTYQLWQTGEAKIAQRAWGQVGIRD